MTDSLYEILGWLGAAAFVSAYMLLSLKFLSPEKVLYHAMNAAGGILMAISTYYIHDRPAFLVNIIWMGIALFSIFRIMVLNTKKK